MGPSCSLRSVKLMSCLGNVIWRYIQNLFLKYIYIYIVLDVLECSIAEYFYGLYRVINYPTGFFFSCFFLLSLSAHFS